MTTRLSILLLLAMFFSQLAFADQTTLMGMQRSNGEGSATVSNSEGISVFNSDSSSFYRNLNSSAQGNFFEPKVLRGASSINVYRKGSFGTVLIISKDGVGSGAILTNKVHILTNQHVVGKNNKVLVYFKKNGNEKIKFEDGVEADVIKVDEVSDLALLQLPRNRAPSNMRPIPISERKVEVGADAHAIGHPSNQLWTYTKGYISQIRNDFRWNEIHEANVLQIQTPINPGNSGGPLLNSNGQLIGINSFKDIQNDSMNYAVDNSSINKFLSRSGSRFAEVKKECEVTKIGESYRSNDKDFGPTSNQDFDLTCDGKADSTLIIPDDKTQAVFTTIDSNGDGKTDIILVDENRDGKVNYSFIDSDHDGNADQKGIHTSGDIIPDRYEAIG